MTIDSGRASDRNLLRTPLALLLAGLSLSIGWGIRGNYGHEIGAMLPGALAAIAVCLLSGREDWRERVAYFALFGALGWALGGTMSYMQVIAYSHSGHAPSQYFGFFSLFVIGFLWAAFGGAGTALPAVLDRRELCDLFRPLSVVLSLWLLWFFIDNPVAEALQTQFDSGFGGVQGDLRHESVLYWFDSDWLTVLVIIVGLLAFDLVDRHFGKSLWLPLYAAIGGLLGHFAEAGIVRAGWSGPIHDLLVHTQGDDGRFDKSRLVTNWPSLFVKESEYLGLAIGLFLGIGCYFARYGKFRRGSSLFLHMALGWFVGFLLLPVFADVRMTPPRGDNWAGILGAYGGFLVYCYRRGLGSLIATSLIAGVIGGIGFSGIACVEGLLESFGNANLAPGLAEAWNRWQVGGGQPSLPTEILSSRPLQNWEFWLSSNWHSFLEQSYGFVNGLAVAVALACVIRRIEPLKNESKRQYWTEIFALTVAVPLMIYLNLVKNVGMWTQSSGGHPAAMPAVMKMPLVGFPLSTWAWFNVFCGIAAFAFVLLLNVHRQRKLALLQQSWLGRGQWLFLLLLWVFVIGNFGRILVRFDERRLLTEGMITINAILATLLILLLPTASAETERLDEPSDVKSTYGGLIGKAAVATLLCAVLFPVGETLCLRAVYGNAAVLRHGGARGPETRFGPHANWKYQPLFKGMKHR